VTTTVDACALGSAESCPGRRLIVKTITISLLIGLLVLVAAAAYEGPSPDHTMAILELSEPDVLGLFITVVGDCEFDSEEVRSSLQALLIRSRIEVPPFIADELVMYVDVVCMKASTGRYVYNISLSFGRLFEGRILFIIAGSGYGEIGIAQSPADILDKVIKRAARPVTDFIYVHQQAASGE
jgi:hypothetical protein